MGFDLGIVHLCWSWGHVFFSAQALLSAAGDVAAAIILDGYGTMVRHQLWPSIGAFNQSQTRQVAVIREVIENN